MHDQLTAVLNRPAASSHAATPAAVSGSPALSTAGAVEPPLRLLLLLLGIAANEVISRRSMSLKSLLSDFLLSFLTCEMVRGPVSAERLRSACCCCRNCACVTAARIAWVV